MIKKLNKRGGFTLVKMLVVIAVIGLLASMVLIGLGGARPAARDARRISDLRQLQTVVELFFQSKDRYPTAAEFAVPSTLGISALPKDPLRTGGEGGSGYAYGSMLSGKSYVLKAWLERDNPALNNSNELDGAWPSSEGTAIANDDGTGCADTAPSNYHYCVTSPL